MTWSPDGRRGEKNSLSLRLKAGPSIRFTSVDKLHQFELHQFGPPSMTKKATRS